ncbi:alpha/beta hydrolase [Mucilaginibacter psychrotolerans]|uniref:Alpha/beta hydrolase n=1 Tax=Mucilaginibacter psychrotolerans TaxID=1524096 RepID=A0A4Y8SHY7_9SPHI|nr:alpha/beta hydrolase [Mucilaginibacter psychrotolerans]TFF38245.1 alpha/beta hydrolase [Mucilaginibacter psychrotolerans]
MKTLLAASILMISTIAAFGQEQKPLLLYPAGVPNSKPIPARYIEAINETSWITKVSIPTITPYLPEKGTANGAAIVIFPGGGYGGLANKHEGTDIAKAFNSIGVTAFLVKYRLPSDEIMVDKTIGPLQDAQRAIQMVRQGAAGWGVDPNRIGIIGFSAGGHLASTAGTHFDKVVIENKDNISVRPDFMMLIYPVISFGPKAHVGSRENLIGKTPSQAMIDFYSNEKQVTANTPPTFLIHAQDDGAVPVENSLMMYEALTNAKVKVEMHLFQNGGHGFGMPNPTTKEKWFDWAAAWMEANGWLKK